MQRDLRTLLSFVIPSPWTKCYCTFLMPTSSDESKTVRRNSPPETFRQFCGAMLSLFRPTPVEHLRAPTHEKPPYLCSLMTRWALTQRHVVKAGYPPRASKLPYHTLLPPNSTHRFLWEQLRSPRHHWTRKALPTSGCRCRH